MKMDISSIAKVIREADTKSLFAIAGACLVEINTRIQNGKVAL